MRFEDKRVGIERDEEEVDQQRRLDRAHADEYVLETGDDHAEERGHRGHERDQHYERMVKAVRHIFAEQRGPSPTLAGREFSRIDELDGFSREELRALEFLQTAVRGRTRDELQIVYAADRLDLLEQALAVLYPTMAHGLEDQVAELRDQHDEVVEKVAELRDRLVLHEDAQDELDDLQQRNMLKAEADADGDKEDEDEDENENENENEDAAKPRRSTLGHEDDDEAAP